VKREYVRRVVVYGDHFKEFRRTLDRNVLRKLYQVFTLIMVMEAVPTKFLKAIEGRSGLYEIRMECSGDAFRVFCCFDEGNLVVLFNGFQKKTRKTPSEQLDKAERLMKEYFMQKQNKQWNDG